VCSAPVEAAQAVNDEIVGEMSMGAVRMPVPKISVPSPSRGATGMIDASAL
jgi:hypothetical protein